MVLTRREGASFVLDPTSHRMHLRYQVLPASFPAIPAPSPANDSARVSLRWLVMSDQPNAQPAREPTLTSLLASIVRENRPGRTVRLVDPVRTHGHNPLKRAYIYALLDSRGVMRVIGSTRSSLPVRFSCYRSSLRNPHHTTSPLLRYIEPRPCFVICVSCTSTIRVRVSAP